MFKMMKLDCFGMKSFWLRIFLRALVPFAMILLNMPLMVMPLMAFMMQDSAFYAFVAEEKGKLNHLYMTLPVNRKMIVHARFTLIIIGLFIGIALGTALLLASSVLLYGRTLLGLPFVYTFNPDLNTMLLIICGSALFCAIINLPSLPLLLKLGYNKGKFIGFYLPSFGMFALAIVTINLISNVEAFREFTFSAIDWALSNIVGTSAIMLGTSTLLFAASYVISQRVYAKREF